MFFSMGGSPVHHLLILVAMDVEERAILDICPKFDDIEIDGRLGIFGKQLSFSNFKMTLVNTGIGLVNAGLATAVASQKLAVDAILLLGVAGALREDQEIGDIILADVILQHDSFFSSENSNEMMAPGFPYVSLNQSERESPVFRTDATFEKWLRSKSIVLSKGTILFGSNF